MTLSIPSEYEAIIQQAVASGEFATPEDAVKHALRLLAEERELAKEHGLKPKLSTEERLKRAQKFREWAARQHPAGHFVDDSRESIY